MTQYVISNEFIYFYSVVRLNIKKQGVFYSHKERKTEH